MSLPPRTTHPAAPPSTRPRCATRPPPHTTHAPPAPGPAPPPPRLVAAGRRGPAAPPDAAPPPAAPDATTRALAPGTAPGLLAGGSYDSAAVDAPAMGSSTPPGAPAADTAAPDA